MATVSNDPMIMLMSFLYENADKINNKNIKNLIENSLVQMPNQKDKVLDRIEKHLPQFKEEIYKYRILL